MITALAWWSLGCAALPALLFIRNLAFYRPIASESLHARVSVLIPARNEALNIGAALDAVLANKGAELEVVVLDDHSSDETAEIVATIAARDARVRLATAPELPAGWCGKQHACWVLAHHAMHPLVVFVDADVRLSPDALTRFAAFMESSGADLISGVPNQITGSWMERLLIPLIHFVLLGFLPLDRMRKDLSPAYGAGCGQLFIARREAYFQSGGHREIRSSMHDGLMLPRAFRRAGFRTDLFDATDLATCRMYRSAREVWQGLGKNATEGLANPQLIAPMTVLLFSGQVLPWGLVLLSPASWIAWLAAILSLVPRLVGVLRFRHSITGALLHPVGVFLLLVIQWTALVKKMRGQKQSWRGRVVEPVAFG